MPKVKEGSGSRTTRSAGKTEAKAPAAPPAQAKPVTARPTRKAATKVAATSPKPLPRPQARAAAKADGRTGDDSRRRTTSKTKGKATTRVTAKGARKAAPAARKGAKRLPVGKVKLEPVRGVKIRELNPQEKCGPGTSVLQLFRVDESLGRELTTHLVFFDRHGWYCEHGRTCRAVTDVQKLGKRMLVGL